MVARIQGWDQAEYRWEFTGRKTASYRQIGNAFPPPVARALGEAIGRALRREGVPRGPDASPAEHDPVYAVLRDHGGFLTAGQIQARLADPPDLAAVERRLAHLGHDFHIEVRAGRAGDAYRLGAFKAFTGQHDHTRHAAFVRPSRIS
jgi:DNA (cytosine-5)-methyltransferase 1